VRAAAMIDDLRARLNTPGLADEARAEMQALIDQLTTAQESGDIEAVLRLTGTDEARGQLDETTGDREATVKVESRGGPAVVAYLDRIANAERLSIIRVESRNGPAVREYVDGLTAERLLIIRLETRGGPAVREYLDELTRDREVAVNVNRGTGGGAPGPYGAPALATAASSRFAVGSVTLDLELTGTADRGQLSRAQRGRAHVEDIRAYERENGTGWRRAT
jgi:hypothetical protein